MSLPLRNLYTSCLHLTSCLQCCCCLFICFIVSCLLLNSLYFVLTLLLYFCLFVNYVNKFIIFVFGAFVYHFKNTISQLFSSQAMWFHTRLTEFFLNLPSPFVLHGKQSNESAWRNLCEICINVNKLLAVLLLPVYLFYPFFLYCTLIVACLLLNPRYFILTLLLYFCLFVDYVNKFIIFVFGAFFNHFKNTFSIFQQCSISPYDAEMLLEIDDDTLRWGVYHSLDCSFVMFRALTWYRESIFDRKPLILLLRLIFLCNIFPLTILCY